MTREEHKAAVNRLLGMVASEHQATASELLTNLSDDYEQTLTAHEQAQNSVRTLTENNESLRAVNTKLFLRVGDTEKALHKEDKTPDKPKDEIPSFDTLFNEKGELI